MTPLTFTLDLEDPRPDERMQVRFPAATRQLLDFFAQHRIEATIFIVGTTAHRDPLLVRDIVSAGHRIASHSLDHVPLDRQTPARFREDTRRAKETLEDIAGASVNGFRAPVFSLTPQTVWALDVLLDLGFSYSSSVLPAGNPLHGFPGAPELPFRWANGLLEIPAPVTAFGPMRLPFLGGFYLRYLPRRIIARAMHESPAHSALWAYVHPHDIDHGAPFFRMKDTPMWVSVLLWLNRRRTCERLEFLIGLSGPGATFESFERRIAAGHFDTVPLYAP